MSVTINNPLIVMQKQAEASGKKFTTGTYTPAQERVVNIITHNLGTIPTTFLVYPTDYEAYEQNYPSQSEQAKGQLMYFTGTYYSFVGGATFTTIAVKQGNINSGSYQPQGVDVSAFPARYQVTETTAMVLGTNPNYYLSVGVEYTWIAIE